jgi:hypothetical protein
MRWRVFVCKMHARPCLNYILQIRVTTLHEKCNLVVKRFVFVQR